MPPPRDSFGLALGALKRRLREGRDAPGQALPIQAIAEELRLSTTPVREALSRLAGENLVDKQGPTYTRPRIDGQTLVELYGLRWLYLAEALTPRAWRTRRLPLPDARAFVESLADPDRSPSAVIDAVFLESVLRSHDIVLAQAYQRVSERLAPFQQVEAAVFADLRHEAQDIARAMDAGEAAPLRALVRLHHRRRMAAGHVLAGLANAPGYRTDIV